MPFESNNTLFSRKMSEKNLLKGEDNSCYTGD